MLAKDIMTMNVITVSPDDRVEEIAKLLLERGISAAPVVEEDGGLLGIVSEGDLIRRCVGDSEGHRSWWLKLLTGPADRARDYVKIHGHRVKDVMTPDVVKVSEDTSIGEIAYVLEKRGIKRVPVVRDGKVVGIVSRANLLHGLAAQKDRAAMSPSPDDRTIREQIMDVVTREGWVTHGSLNVMVTDGMVELWGWVDSEDERKALILAAEEMAGVAGVQDHLGSVPPYLRGT